MRNYNFCDSIVLTNISLPGERAVDHLLEPGPAVRDDDEEDRLRLVVAGSAQATAQMPDEDLVSRTEAAVHGGRTGQWPLQRFTMVRLAVEGYSSFAEIHPFLAF